LQLSHLTEVIYNNLFLLLFLFAKPLSQIAVLQFCPCAKGCKSF